MLMWPKKAKTAVRYAHAKGDGHTVGLMHVQVALSPPIIFIQKTKEVSYWI